MRLIPGISGLLLGLFSLACQNDYVQDSVRPTEDHQKEVSSDIMLTESQIRLGNITTRRVAQKPLGQTVIINGRLAVNEERTDVISSRDGGRIEKLFVKETGQTIRRGQPLYTLYSENLLTLQQEYLLAKEQYIALGATEKRYKSFLEAAEKKLLLYGLTKTQISQLTRATLQPKTTFLSPFSGIITEINVAEGQYVAEGAPLYKTEDISTLWVEGDLYPDEASLVSVGDRIHVRITGSDANIEGRITFLSPEYRNNTQITVMRALIENPGNMLKPGQHTQVFLTHATRNAISVPVDAIIRDDRGTHLYIQSGNNTFRPQVVETGMEGFDEVEITKGLNEGDTVAVTGAYLLYSEVILRKGTDPMDAGHKH